MWRSWRISLWCLSVFDHPPDTGEIARGHVRRGDEVIDEGRGIAREQSLGQLAHHRMLHVRFRDRGAVEELSVARAPRDDAPTLQTRDECRDRRLREAALLVERLPQLGDGGLTPLPEQAQDGQLELGELMTLGHCDSQEIYKCRFTLVVCI